MSDTWNTLKAFWDEHVKGTDINMSIHFFPLVYIVNFFVPKPDCYLRSQVTIDSVLERNPDALHTALLHAITELKK